MGHGSYKCAQRRAFHRQPLAGLSASGQERSSPCVCVCLVCVPAGVACAWIEKQHNAATYSMRAFLRVIRPSALATTALSSACLSPPPSPPAARRRPINHRLGQNSTPGCDQKTRLISILMGATMQLLEVVTGHSQFLSHFSIPQAMPTQPVTISHSRLFDRLPRARRIRKHEQRTPPGDGAAPPRPCWV